MKTLLVSAFASAVLAAGIAYAGEVPTSDMLFSPVQHEASIAITK
ncbi:MAG: hypothetical protein ABJK39_11555 [Hyphomicrobiales bacterium]